MFRCSLFAAGMFLALAGATAAFAQEAAPPADAAARLARRPKQFAIMFNRGYGGDHFPADAAGFERMLLGAKEAGFNAVFCPWTEERSKLCQKHEMMIFVDLLSPPHHVYKSAEETQKILEGLRNRPEIYGYHLWSDNIGETYPGRSRDVKNVHTWDPTHPAYVGTYRMGRVSRVEDLDLLGYYDFHWKRGGHWENLGKAMQTAKGKDAFFLRYCDAAPGQVGQGNANRAAWTIATSIPFGLKGYTYHYVGGVVDPDTGKLDTLGEDLKKVNLAIAPLGPELMKLGNPTALYSTRVTKDNKNRLIDSPEPVSPGLPDVPADNYFQIRTGEVLVGLFTDPQGKKVVATACHNAYEEQQVAMKLADGAAKTASRFDPVKKAWEPLEIAGGKVEFTVSPLAPTLVRFE